jgi:hypothetical protein
MSRQLDVSKHLVVGNEVDRTENRKPSNFGWSASRQDHNNPPRNDWCTDAQRSAFVLLPLTMQLLSKITVGGQELKNRLVVAPMTRAR